MSGQRRSVSALCASAVMLRVFVMTVLDEPFLLNAGWVSVLAGGALGNIIDRVLYGAVTDMFELLFIRFYIFNVADVGVVAGAILCGISLLFRPQDWSKR